MKEDKRCLWGRTLRLWEKVCREDDVVRRMWGEPCRVEMCGDKYIRAMWERGISRGINSNRFFKAFI